MTKSFELGDLFTDEELALAQELKDARKIADQIIKPAIDRINRVTNQENDPLYFGYLLSHAVNNYGKRLTH